MKQDSLFKVDHYLADEKPTIKSSRLVPLGDFAQGLGLNSNKPALRFDTLGTDDIN